MTRHVRGMTTRRNIVKVMGWSNDAGTNLGVSGDMGGTRDGKVGWRREKGCFHGWTVVKNELI
jgi:hypothetical protein